MVRDEPGVGGAREGGHDPKAGRVRRRRAEPSLGPSRAVRNKAGVGGAREGAQGLLKRTPGCQKSLHIDGRVRCRLCAGARPQGRANGAACRCERKRGGTVSSPQMGSRHPCRSLYCLSSRKLRNWTCTLASTPCSSPCVARRTHHKLGAPNPHHGPCSALMTTHCVSFQSS